MLKDFDPEICEMDRRLYYEVTRDRLNEDEFVDSDSSDEDFQENSTAQKPAKVEAAFLYSGDESEDSDD